MQFSNRKFMIEECRMYKELKVFFVSRWVNGDTPHWEELGQAATMSGAIKLMKAHAEPAVVVTYYDELGNLVD